MTLRAWKERVIYIMGSGEQWRPFVHINDVVQALLLGVEEEAERVAGEIFNVGSGENISVKELADMISPRQTHTEARKGDAAITLADISRIKAMLGWTPQVSFAEGLKELKALIN